MADYNSAHTGAEIDAGITKTVTAVESGAALPSGDGISGTAISYIKQCTQAAYDGGTPAADTLYVIVG